MSKQQGAAGSTWAVGHKSIHMIASLASGAFVGKVLGFVREILMARVFGASLITDSFRSSSTAVAMPLIPMQNEGVPAVIIPMHLSWQKDGTAPRKLAALCAGLSMIALAIMLTLQISGSWGIRLLVGRMEPEGQALTLQIFRVMAFWMPASVLLNCLAAAEIATGRSRIAALRPTILNLSVIAGIVLFGLTGHLYFLPLFFALSFNLLAAYGVWSLRADGSLDPSGLEINLIVDVCKEFARRLRPLLLQPLAEQGQVWLERFIASGFVVGTLGSIDFARTLTDSAVLLIGQPIGMAVLASASSKEARHSITSIATPLMVIAIPGAIFLAVFAPDIVGLVFARGAFDETAVRLTSGALRGIAMGIWAATLGSILMRFLNLAGRNREAALVLASAFAGNAVVNIIAWKIVGSSGDGSYLIGLGEAMRGLILLAGTAVLLEVHWPLLRLGRQLLPAAATALILCLSVQVGCKGTWPHLTFGTIACMASIVVAARHAMPEQLNLTVAHLVARAKSFRLRFHS